MAPSHSRYYALHGQVGSKFLSYIIRIYHFYSTLWEKIVIIENSLRSDFRGQKFNGNFFESYSLGQFYIIAVWLLLAHKQKARRPHKLFDSILESSPNQETSRTHKYQNQSQNLYVSSNGHLCQKAYRVHHHKQILLIWFMLTYYCQFLFCFFIYYYWFYFSPNHPNLYTAMKSFILSIKNTKSKFANSAY